MAVLASNLARAFQREEMVVAGQVSEADGETEWDPHWPELVYVGRDRSFYRFSDRHLRLVTAPWLVNRVLRLVRQRRCTDIVGVYPDESYLFAAWYVSRRTNCRLYPYFHNTDLESRWGLWRDLAAWLQPRVFRDARHVFVMSAGMMELYRARYPAFTRCSPLVHAYSEAVPDYAEPAIRDRLQFALSGRINPSCADAARRLCRVAGAYPGASLRFFTGDSQQALEKEGVWGPAAELSWLSRDEFLQGLRQADILLLPHGFRGMFAQVEYDTIFPTRTIEYLISGRPILAHSPPGAFLTRFLKEHDCALVVEEADPQAIHDAIEKLRRDATLRARLVRNALEAARMFHISRVTAHLRKVLEMPVKNARCAVSPP
jgi:glycosyltransferase involved in cell wall biosynthesis